jgi:hypothetical protein
MTGVFREAGLKNVNSSFRPPDGRCRRELRYETFVIRGFANSLPMFKATTEQE